MTTLQKEILITIIGGGNVAGYQKQHYRVRDAKQNVVRSFSAKTFHSIKHLLRLNDKGLYIVNKQAIRQQRKSTWIKKYYLSQHIQ